MTDQANGSSQEIGKVRDSLVEAGCLNPLDIHLWPLRQKNKEAACKHKS